MFDTTLPQEDIRSPGSAIDDQTENLGVFLGETHHRMKNTLTLLGAWLRSDFKSTASVDLPKAIDGFERRIVAFGRLYDLLSDSSDRRYTSIGDYVGSLSRALAVAILEPKGIRCEVAIGYGFLESKRCELVGVITIQDIPDIQAVWRPLIQALCHVVPVRWIASQHSRRAWLAGEIETRSSGAALLGSADLCADPLNEVREALRWARALDPHATPL
jgi:Histidine kinase